MAKLESCFETRPEQTCFFETVFETENVNDDYIGHLKVFPDIQDHPDHRGSHQQVPGGPEPGDPQGLVF